MADTTVSIRRLGANDQSVIPLAEAIDQLTRENKARSR
jgi:hypothetical protein